MSIPPALHSAVVLGHSFVSGLADHLWPGYKVCSTASSLPNYHAQTLGVSDKVKQVHFIGKRGAKITHDYVLPATDLVHLKPEIAVLDIGSNDLSSGADIGDVVDLILAYARALRDLYGCKAVRVCSILYRKMPATARVTTDAFSRHPDVANERLRQALVSEPYISFHPHSRLVGSLDPSKWSRDGIHPNSQEGRKHYKASMREALHKAARDARHNLPQG